MQGEGWGAGGGLKRGILRPDFITLKQISMTVQVIPVTTTGPVQTE